MSNRKIGHNMPTIIEEMGITYNACIDAPVTIQRGAVVAMAEALKQAVEWDGQDDHGIDAVWMEDARAALAMYYGENQ